ncbi:MAG TPA: hypothetical protein VES67_05100 [Vicinamibacterales bacterium]|nr:hypothetical protein [Vicinamibacterales bacterium]
MTEISTLDKHACPACGAQAEWNPGKQKLVCAYCGTESPYVIDRTTGEAVENDLVKALRELPDEDRGWNTERRSVQCQSCRAVMVFDPSRVGQNCEFCGSPALVAYSEIKAPIRPQSLLPFKIPAGRIRDDMRRWLTSHWLAPGALARSALIDTIKSLYIPYWTFDANVRCPWEADAGHYYYVSVPHRDQQGRTSMRQERRVRWEPASGEITHTFDDEPVPGTHGIDIGLLRQVEPFPTRDLVPYDTAFLSGHVVEHYQVVLFDAASVSQQQMHEKLEQLCAAQVPGDTYRNLVIHPVYSNQTFKHVLVPVWLLAYDYGPKKFQVVANGYTGVIAGRYPYSAWKIFFLVVVIAIVLIVLMYVVD